MNANTLFSSRLAISRNAAIAVVVVALHVGFIWALQSGLFRRATELVVPVELLAQFIEPPAPKVAPPSPPTPPQVKKAITKAPAVTAPLPLAINDPTPASNAPTGTTTPQPAPAPIAASVAVGTLPRFAGCHLGSLLSVYALAGP